MMNESKRLKELKRNFDTVYQRSLDKDAFLGREIEGYSLIIDENILKLPILSTDDEPLVNYNIPYSSMQVFLIRQFYIHFIVEGSDISEIEKDEWNSWVREMYDFALDNLSEPNGPKYYYYLASDLYEYLKWLKLYSETKSKYPDKYYAWYHKIRIAIGKSDQFTPGAKQEIIEYGKNKYKAKGGFYQAFLDFDLTKHQPFVKSLSPKDRKNWKKIIIKISENDCDVINYLEDFPN